MIDISRRTIRVEHVTGQMDAARLAGNVFLRDDRAAVEHRLERFLRNRPLFDHLKTECAEAECGLQDNRESERIDFVRVRHAFDDDTP